MRRNIVYKVVFENLKGEYLSTNASAESYTSELPDFAKLKYGVGRTTIPQIGKLFVFKDLNDAKLFKRSNDFKIIKGYAANVEDATTLKRLIANILTLRQADLFKNFWKKSKEDRTNDANGVRTPAGTHFADSFTGLEMVRY